MGNDIGLGVSFKSVCFDFFSTNVGSSVIGNCASNGFDDMTYLRKDYLFLFEPRKCHLGKWLPNDIFELKNDFFCYFLSEFSIPWTHPQNPDLKPVTVCKRPALLPHFIQHWPTTDGSANSSVMYRKTSHVGWILHLCAQAYSLDS